MTIQMTFVYLIAEVMKEDSHGDTNTEKFLPCYYLLSFVFGLLCAPAVTELSFSCRSVPRRTGQGLRVSCREGKP